SKKRVRNNCSFCFFIEILPTLSRPTCKKIDKFLIKFAGNCTALSSIEKQYLQRTPPSCIENEVSSSDLPQFTQLSTTGANPPLLNNFISYINKGIINASCSFIHAIVCCN